MFSLFPWRVRPKGIAGIEGDGLALGSLTGRLERFGYEEGLRITPLIHTTATSETTPSTTPALAKIRPVISGVGETWTTA